MPRHQISVVKLDYHYCRLRDLIKIHFGSTHRHFNEQLMCTTTNVHKTAALLSKIRGKLCFTHLFYVGLELV